jgi:hypothetical protein
MEERVEASLEAKNGEPVGRATTLTEETEASTET